ncbi:BsuPI-related putative proteinase inhibitor [Longimicrobium terrae]|uniref:Intracellular proteinase inhibitor BsuPI domain-containing protein n=1 Tax=Longimicrobium terrae TaxID=1639882 RepID=A0A841H1V9_9BACT|nr:BsuPI-related putative proteinase inhibitor [Longimicrobium terrae]MBB4637610.1 hypothetical protein [Longimicrobium terrae]MBB6072007.1 hypothetical protein [Longimicrobium terrae]NNC29906.1 hypothetical protein [Longimicrobium terrae]
MVLRRALFPLALATLCGACAAAVPAPGSPDAQPGGVAFASPLVSSLSVAPAGDSVRLTLRVTNGGAQPVRMEFRSGQTYDFAVASGGREVWRWSADRGFTAALRSETLAAGETRAWSETWRPAAGSRGDFTASARLVSASHPVEASTPFRLP